jgi:hypothetical protein
LSSSCLLRAFADYSCVPPDAFTRHHIEKNVPVEALVKCKMQDNLEFLQWAKRYWDKYFPGGDYDALTRRKASGAPAGGPAPSMGGGATRRPTGGVAPRTRTPQSGGASAALASENNALKETVQGLERERDFYFSKLRDIELLIQQEIEAHPELEQQEDGILKQIQTILYSTEVSAQITSSSSHPSRLTISNRRVSKSRKKLRARWARKRLSKRLYSARIRQYLRRHGTAVEGTFMAYLLALVVRDVG